MNESLGRFSTNFSPPAFTLIEVVASLLLLSTLLVGILVAQKRHVHQLNSARERLEAVEVADELLTQWMTAGSGPPAAQGDVPGHENLVWTWEVTGRPELEKFDAAVGQLQIHAREVFPGSDPLVSVELLTPGGLGTESAQR